MAAPRTTDVTTSCSSCQTQTPYAQARRPKSPEKQSFRPNSAGQQQQTPKTLVCLTPAARLSLRCRCRPRQATAIARAHKGVAQAQRAANARDTGQRGPKKNGKGGHLQEGIQLVGVQPNAALPQAAANFNSAVHARHQRTHACARREIEGGKAFCTCPSFRPRLHLEH